MAEIDIASGLFGDDAASNYYQNCNWEIDTTSDQLGTPVTLTYEVSIDSLNCCDTCGEPCDLSAEGDWYVAIGVNDESGNRQGQLFDFNITVSWSNLPTVYAVQFNRLANDPLRSLVSRNDRRIFPGDSQYYIINPTTEPARPSGYSGYTGTMMSITLRAVAPTDSSSLSALLTQKNVYPDFGCSPPAEPYGYCEPNDVCSLVVYPCDFEVGATWYLTITDAAAGGPKTYVEYGLQVMLSPEVMKDVYTHPVTDHPPLSDAARVVNGPWVAYGSVREFEYKHYSLVLTETQLADQLVYLGFEVYVDFQEDDITVFINELAPDQTVGKFAGHHRQLSFTDRYGIHPNFAIAECAEPCYENEAKWTCTTNENVDHSGVPDAFDPQEPRIGMCHYKIERCQLKPTTYYFSVFGNAKHDYTAAGNPLNGHASTHDQGIRFTAT
mmetsp:Transcript_2532/g.3694  ORF Transcript_2532/g.3694 Transcript_2532/m.3694 type:complete len:439 (-) Transcript_2532:1273-2589(-)